MKCSVCQHTPEEQDPIYCDSCRDDIEHENGLLVIEATEAKEAARQACEHLRALVFEGLTFDGSALVPSTALKSELRAARKFLAGEVAARSTHARWTKERWCANAACPDYEAIGGAHYHSISKAKP